MKKQKSKNIKIALSEKEEKMFQMFLIMPNQNIKQIQKKSFEREK